jgi:hypothetical protein
MTVSRPITFKRLLLAASILSSPLIAMAPTRAFAQVGIEISVPLAPPELPVYDQPPMPDVGYIWTPGYWSWNQDAGYYWVPGTWVQPPQANVLWTPPYWGWNNGAYMFYAGYWGSQVGYYGGVDYGYGYSGRGYQGGRWQGSHFVYNRAANNFGSVHVANSYTRNVSAINNSHVSYAGGTGGLRTMPTAAERRVAQEHHVPMTSEQTSHVSAAAKLPDLAAKNNGGHPAIAATARPAQFEGTGVVHAAPASTDTHASAPSKPAGEARPGQPAEHAVAPPAEHGAPPSAEHAVAPPAEHGTPPSAEHAVAPPAEHGATRPAEHAAAPPAEHEAAPRPAEHAVAPPAAHEAAPRPAEHVAAPPAQHEAVRAVAPPRAAPPAQHAAAPPAPHPAPARAEPAPAEKDKK